MNCLPSQKNRTNPTTNPRRFQISMNSRFVQYTSKAVTTLSLCRLSLPQFQYAIMIQWRQIETSQWQDTLYPRHITSDCPLKSPTYREFCGKSVATPVWICALKLNHYTCMYEISKEVQKGAGPFIRKGKGFLKRSLKGASHCPLVPLTK